MVPNNDIWGAAREVLALYLVVHFKVHKKGTFFLTCDVLLTIYQRAKEQQRISSHPLPKNRRHSNYRSTSPVWLWNVKKICITNRVLEEPCRTTINKCIKNTQEEGLFAPADAPIIFWGRRKNWLMYVPQCKNFRIFLSLRFYVKSILENLEVPNLPFLPF